MAMLLVTENNTLSAIENNLVWLRFDRRRDHFALRGHQKQNPAERGFASDK
jgi:hypothetical protein